MDRQNQVLIRLDEAVFDHTKCDFFFIGDINQIVTSIIYSPPPSSFLLFFPSRRSPSYCVVPVSTQTDEEPELIVMLQTQALVSNNITLSWVTSTCPASLYTVPVWHQLSRTGRCYCQTHLHNVRKIPNSSIRKFWIMDWSWSINLSPNYLVFNRCFDCLIVVFPKKKKGNSKSKFCWRTTIFGFICIACY